MTLNRNFFWGGSASSFQTEGNWKGDGKGISVIDRREVKEDKSDWNVGVDFYHRYQEDIRLLRDMGCNFYRIQLSWSRIFPDGDGEVNPKGLDFYDNVIDCLVENGIEPMICLIHFDIPQSLVDRFNGFQSRYVVDCFDHYARTVMKRYGNRVRHWLTFNEHNLNHIGFRFTGSKNLCEASLQKELYQVNHNTLIAHCKAVKSLREIVPNGKMSGMMTYKLFYPLNSDPQNVFFARRLNDFFNNFHMHVFAKGEYPEYMMRLLKSRDWMPRFEPEDNELLKYTCDILAFSYYNSQVVSYRNFGEFSTLQSCIDATTVRNPFCDSTQWGWEIDPIGLRYILNDLQRLFDKPLFILENGIGLSEEVVDGHIKDEKRIEYHKKHIQEMKNAILDDGVDCIGYLTWAPIDMLSSGGEMEKRYGFVYVDRGEKELRSLDRIKKRSFDYIRKVFTSNGEIL